MDKLVCASRPALGSTVSESVCERYRAAQGLARPQGGGGACVRAAGGLAAPDAAGACFERQRAAHAHRPIPATRSCCRDVSRSAPPRNPARAPRSARRAR